MRAIAKIAGLLMMLSLGAFIGGLIFGNEIAWKRGLLFFLLCIFIGPIAQYIADWNDERLEREIRAIREEAERKMLRPKEAGGKLNDLTDFSCEDMRVFAEILKKSGIADEQAKMKIDGMEKRFKEHYTRLRSQPMQGRAIRQIGEDPSGEFLFEVFASMPYAPPRYAVHDMYAVCALEIEGNPAIRYAVKNCCAGGIQYVSFFLVQTQKGIRLFSVEQSGRSCWFLCEFAQGRHINYDAVDPREFIEGIAKVLRSEKEKKTT